MMQEPERTRCGKEVRRVVGEGEKMKESGRGVLVGGVKVVVERWRKEVEGG